MRWVRDNPELYEELVEKHGEEHALSEYFAERADAARMARKYKGTTENTQRSTEQELDNE